MCSPATGKSYDPPTPKHFSFNAPAGACPVCHGLGQKMVFDEDLVVPDPEQPLESAIQPWRRAGKRMNIYYKAMLRSVAAHFNVSLETPWKNLPDDFKNVLLHGSGEDEIDFRFWRAGSAAYREPAVRGRAAEPGAAVHRERKRIRPQPHQALHEPASFATPARASG